MPLGEFPPLAPRDCFGRDEVIEKVVGLAENLEPVALICTEDPHRALQEPFHRSNGISQTARYGSCPMFRMTAECGITVLASAIFRFSFAASPVF